MQQRISYLAIVIGSLTFAGCISNPEVKGNTVKPPGLSSCEKAVTRRAFTKCVKGIIKTAQLRESAEIKSKRVKRERPGGWWANMVHEEYQISRHDLLHTIKIVYYHPDWRKRILVEYAPLIIGILIAVFG